MCRGLQREGSVGVLEGQEDHQFKSYRVSFEGDHRVPEKIVKMCSCSRCREFKNKKDKKFVDSLEKNKMFQGMVLVTA